MLTQKVHFQFQLTPDHSISSDLSLNLDYSKANGSISYLYLGSLFLKQPIYTFIRSS